MTGFINFLKPPGMSSHDAVSFIRRLFNIQQVGHAGTLDPAASGVLPLAVGPATRLLEYIAGEEKAYRAEITLGYETDTGDDTGKILTFCQNFRSPLRDEIEAVLAKMVGTISQVPPMYSAVKVNGRKLYEIAAQGREVERSSREVNIQRISLLEYDGKKFYFDVICSKGTYIRSLCVDIGKHLGLPAVMSFLVRTRVGSFRLESAKTIEEITEQKDRVLLEPSDVLVNLPTVFLTPRSAEKVRSGQTIAAASRYSGIVLLYDTNGHLLGAGRQDGLAGTLAPAKIFPYSAEKV